MILIELLLYILFFCNLLCSKHVTLNKFSKGAFNLEGI